MRSALTQAMKERDRESTAVYRATLGAIDNAVVIEVAVEPAGQVHSEARVDLLVICPIHGAIEISVAVIGVLHKRVRCRSVHTIQHGSAGAVTQRGQEAAVGRCGR